MTHTREQLRSIEWAIADEDGGVWCPACRSSADHGHKLDCWLSASLSAPLASERSTRVDREAERWQVAARALIYPNLLAEVDAVVAQGACGARWHRHGCARPTGHTGSHACADLLQRIKAVINQCVSTLEDDRVGGCECDALDASSLPCALCAAQALLAILYTADK